nr:putative peptidoglycan-binding domain-containing protein [uncultured Fretibacterium sp.]
MSGNECLSVGGTPGRCCGGVNIGIVGWGGGGSGGPKTLAALKPCLTKPENVRAVCLTLLDVRKAYFLRFVERDEKQGKFLKGWMNRLKKLRGYVDEAA